MKIAAPTQDDLDVAKYASLCRVLEQAPIENRSRVFGLMAGCAAADVLAFRQNMIDGLWEVAVEIGLVQLMGTTSTQEAIASAFWSDAL
jgi:hypothetical protein